MQETQTILRFDGHDALFDVENKRTRACARFHRFFFSSFFFLLLLLVRRRRRRRRVRYNSWVCWSLSACCCPGPGPGLMLRSENACFYCNGPREKAHTRAAIPSTLRGTIRVRAPESSCVCHSPECTHIQQLLGIIEFMDHLPMKTYYARTRARATVE